MKPLVVSAPRAHRNVSPSSAPPPSPPPPEEGRGRQLLRGSARGLAEIARWTEVDEVGAILLDTVEGPTVTALNVWDGIVTLVDARKVWQQGRHTQDWGLQVGGLMRVGLGLGGMIPGMPGIVSEACLGAYCLGEGIVRKDGESLAMGATQLGAALGMACMASGVGGHLGQTIAIVSLLGRAGYMAHERWQKD